MDALTPSPSPPLPRHAEAGPDAASPPTLAARSPLDRYLRRLGLTDPAWRAVTVDLLLCDLAPSASPLGAALRRLDQLCGAGDPGLAAGPLAEGRLRVEPDLLVRSAAAKRRRPGASGGASAFGTPPPAPLAMPLQALEGRSRPRPVASSRPAPAAVPMPSRSRSA